MKKPKKKEIKRFPHRVSCKRNKRGSVPTDKPAELQTHLPAQTRPDCRAAYDTAESSTRGSIEFQKPQYALWSSLTIGAAPSHFPDVTLRIKISGSAFLPLSVTSEQRQ